MLDSRRTYNGRLCLLSLTALLWQQISWRSKKLVTACPKMLEQLPEVKRFYPPSYEPRYLGVICQMALDILLWRQEGGGEE